jgi:hypothetical protein
MIEPLLLAVKAAIIAPDSPFDYGKNGCDIRDDGQPPPGCGKWFVAVHELPSRQTGINRIDEYFSYAITLTARVTAPPDRLGHAELARQLAGKIGFNRRLHRLKMFLHQNWDVLQLANNYLVEIAADAPLVYGFCEAGRLADTERPTFVGPDWFDAEVSTGTEDHMGLKAQASFVDIRRFQPIGSYV